MADPKADPKAGSPADPRKDSLACLNPVQRRAAEHVDGPLLVFAGAGTGKTRVLTHRIAYMVNCRRVHPAEILAITFTNKAAAEMRERLDGLMGPEVARELWVSTFHAACVRILRRDFDRVGRDRGFAVFDAHDQAAVMRECLKDLNWDPQRYHPQALLAQISAAKNQLLSPADLESRASTQSELRVVTAYRAYQEKLARNNALDFDDLLFKVVELFRQDPGVLSYYQRRFRYISVDEYQDTNHAQYVWLSLLAREHRNLCVIGDDDQSIYRWRGADVGNILSFRKDYPEAVEIVLELNYRSTPNILSAANEVIRHNPARKEKALRTDNPAGPAVQLYRALDEEDEARFVVEEMDRLRGEDGKTLGDCAVLYRTHAQSRILEDTLVRRGTPYVIVGGLRFYERKEIKDAVAYLRVLAFPHDAVSLQRIINVPRRGIGDVTWDAVLDAAVKTGRAPLEIIIGKGLRTGRITGRSASALDSFAALIDHLREESGRLSLPGLVEEVIHRSGYLAELEAERTFEAQSRVENLKELVSVAREFESTDPEGGLLEFLTQISLLSQVDAYGGDGEAAVLMTLHSAKGLEFPVVFLVGMEEGVFPHARSLVDPEELAEERRLCYVGMTRARERLYLTHAWQRTLYGSRQANMTSRFLQDIPPSLLEDRGGWGSLPEALETGPRSGSFRDAAGAAVRGAAGGTANTAKLSRGVATAGASGRGDRLTPNGGGGVKPDYNLKAGDRVRHKQWGEGTVVSSRGEGQDAILTIAFPDRGIKQVAARYAPLERI
ncbi:MAG: DNA helicase PcrA [Firmicutes bacterium]|nr:DNA helicase PcrA [Bacillota bacterium]